MRVWACLIILLLAGCTTPPTPLTEDGPMAGRTGHALEGQAAPAYTAQTLDGGNESLADHAGRPVLLHIWASWCTVCEGEEDTLAALHEAYGDRIDFVLVSIDEPRFEEAMRSEVADWAYGSLWDPEDTIRPLFQVRYQPVTVFIDANGTIDAVWQGQDADHTTLRAEPDLAARILERL